MRSAEEIIDNHPVYYTLRESTPTEVKAYDFYMVRHLINEARKEAIEECAKVAKAKLNSTALENALSGGSYLSTITNPSKCYVDKESILSLINKLQ